MDSTFHLTMQSVARLVGFLACGVCGLHGPHRHFIDEDGGVSAKCAACRQLVEPEAGQDAGENPTHVLHVPTVITVGAHS